MSFRPDEVPFVPAIAEALADILEQDSSASVPLLYTAVRKRVPQGHAPLSTVKQVLRVSGAVISGHQSTGGQVVQGVRFVARISPGRTPTRPDLDTRIHRAIHG